MAKRKKLKNVVIAPDELTPTTIGYLAEKKSNPLFLLFIFAVLFLFLYYIPDINKYIEKKRGNDYTNNVPSEPEEITYDKNDLKKEFPFKNDTIITINEVDVTGFSLENSKITFKVINNSDKVIDIGENKYYLYIKNNSGDLRAFSLENILLMENKEETLSFDTNLTNVDTIFIDVLNEDYLPVVNLTNDTLTCTLDNDKYIYNFKDNALVKVTYNYYEFGPSNETVEKINAKKSRYDEIDGATTSLKNYNGFDFTVEVDLNTIDHTKIDDPLIFEKGPSPKMVNFQMKNNNFVCS